MRDGRTPARCALLFTWILAFAPGFAAGVPAARASADVDGDGRITLADLKMLSVDLNTLAAAWRGDVNGDGRVDREDVRELARMLIRRGAPDLEPTDALVEALLRHATSGGGGEEVLRVLRGLEGGPAGPREGGGSVRGAAGRPARLGAGLPRYYAGLRETPRDAPTPASFGDLAARRARAFGGPLGDKRAGEAFAAFVSAHPSGEDLVCGDPPDPGALGESARRARSSPIIVSRDGGSRDRVLPRGAVSLVLNPDDPASVSLRATARGTGGSLDDEFRRVSGMDDLAAAVRSLVDPAFRDLPDPLLTQFLTDLADPEAFLRLADLDHDRTVTLDEFLTFFLSPETARRVALGDTEALGLKPGSTLATRYAEIVKAVIPVLRTAGVIDPAFADATLAATGGVAVAGIPGAGNRSGQAVEETDPAAQSGPDKSKGGTSGLAGDTFTMNPKGNFAKPGPASGKHEGATGPDDHVNSKNPVMSGARPAEGEDGAGKSGARPAEGENGAGKSGDSRDVAAAKITLKMTSAMLADAQADIVRIKKEMAELKTRIAEYGEKVNGAHSIAEATYYSKLWQEAKNEYASKNDALRLTSQAVARFQEKIRELNDRIAAGGQ